VSEIKQIVERFRSGDEESAFLLIELPGDILPALIEIFRAERCCGSGFLVKEWRRAP
jgi:hypothetical protein